MVTINDFLTSFPEFAKTDCQRVVQYLDQALIEGCYDTFNDDAVTDLAIKLHTAHYLAVFEQSSSSFSIGGQKVRKLKTKHDEIQFQGEDSDIYGFDKTQYGTRLLRLIERHNVGFDIGLLCW